MNPILKKFLENEINRQNNTINLIPSENFTSEAVRKAVGSVVMHKYSEGYPGKRYYEGNEYIDGIETLCIDMVKKVFKLPSGWGVNVQPLSGSNANLAVYNALLNPEDKILSMFLPDGGHLSHGWSLPDDNKAQEGMVYRGGSRKVNIVSKIYNVVQYKTNRETNLFDYDYIEDLAIKENPKLIITGGTAYTRDIDYKRIKKIADKIGAYYLADIAHEAGLIAAGVLNSPIGIADVVTFTTHKTLRGPKGAIIVARQDLMDKVNKSIIPGMQGGAHNGGIAGITQALFEADTNEFIEYANNIIQNANTLAEELLKRDFNLVTGGTDKHLILVDLRNKNISGKYASKALSIAGVITNMNTIPYDTGTPLNPSGLRIGTPTITTRGMGTEEMVKIAEIIENVINIAKEFSDLEFSEFQEKCRQNVHLQSISTDVISLCNKFPFRN